MKTEVKTAVQIITQITNGGKSRWERRGKDWRLISRDLLTDKLNDMFLTHQEHQEAQNLLQLKTN